MMMAYLWSLKSGTHVQPIPRACPEIYTAVSPSGHADTTLDVAAQVFADLSHPSVQTQTEARARIAMDRAFRKRGPPAPLA
jgi:hypothetical protein